ncbi:MAG: ABC transporter permease [Edaphobacter sp.]|nr:ABC transporter permease [Edaphobacter sp.]MDE1176740.1 ABC transporter permease [Edaphobacter sp.]
MRSLRQRDTANEELSEELQFHLQTLADRHIARGLSPEQAQRAARAEFGDVNAATEAAYESRGTALVDDLMQDLRYGVRSLRRQPAFTLVTVLTLALGIGACTAIFSLVNAVMLRSLPYGDASRLVYLYMPNPRLKELPPEALGPSNADFFDIRQQAHSFSSMTMFDQKTMNLMMDGKAQRIGVAKVDASFFHTLETAPLMGRVFNEEDQQPGNDHAVILSYSLWQSLYGGAADVLHRTITLNDTRYSIAAVMPRDFGYPHHTDLPYGDGRIEATQVWVPYTLTAAQRADREQTSINAMARLKPGVTISEAQAEMSAIVARLEPLHKGFLFKGMTALVKPMNVQVLGQVRPLMSLLLGAVGFVLLIACGNAANLLLARAASRRHELGVRATLGARRGRLIRQMLTESLLLGAAAGAVGIALASLFIRVLLRLNPGDIPDMNAVALDGRALAFLVLVSIATSVAFGALPALTATRINVAEFLSSAGTRGLVADRRGLRKTLVTAQVALVVVLLTGAGLFVRSYLNVLSVDTGFSPATIGMNVSLTPAYDTAEKNDAFYADLLERVQARHGVYAAGLVNFLPLTNSESMNTLEVEGYANRKSQLVETRSITPNYLTAMQTPILRGRNFTPEEKSQSTSHVVMVNEVFAKRFLAGGDPIGRHLRYESNRPWSTVVGVVADTRNMNTEVAAAPQVYDAFFQTGNPPLRGAFLVVRSTMAKDVAIADLLATVRSMDPAVVVSDVHVMSELTEHANAPRRFQTTLLTVFSSTALFLAVVGVYGLLAYSVRQRTGEIGLRMALGSSRSGIMRLVLREGLSLLVAGLCLGIAGAVFFSRMLRGFLYGVPALDPVTFVAVPALLALATLAACLVPSMRAAATDPMVALRHE